MLSCIAWWGPSQFKCCRNHGIAHCKHSRGGWSVQIFTWNFRGYGWTIKWCSQPQDAKWHDRRCWGVWWTRRCRWQLELCLRSCISCGFNGKKEKNRSGVGCSQPVILLHMRSMSTTFGVKFLSCWSVVWCLKPLFLGTAKAATLGLIWIQNRRAQACHPAR